MLFLVFNFWLQHIVTLDAMNDFKLIWVNSKSIAFCDLSSMGNQLFKLKEQIKKSGKNEAEKSLYDSSARDSCENSLIT